MILACPVVQLSLTSLLTSIRPEQQSPSPCPSPPIILSLSAMALKRKMSFDDDVAQAPMVSAQLACIVASH